jgi:hypothetical protein
MFGGRGRLEVGWWLHLDDSDIPGCVLAPGPCQVLSLLSSETALPGLAFNAESFSNKLIPKSTGFRVGL